MMWHLHFTGGYAKLDYRDATIQVTWFVLSSLMYVFHSSFIAEYRVPMNWTLA